MPSPGRSAPAQAPQAHALRAPEALPIIRELRIAPAATPRSFPRWTFSTPRLPLPIMTGLYDSHAHFEDSETAATAMIDRAVEAGVERILAVGGSETLNRGAVRAARARPSIVRLALGWDRDRVSDAPLSRSTLAEALADAGAGDLSLAALGEIGLDYAVSDRPAREQRERFAKQAHEALQANLPIIVHSRDARDDTLAILGEAARIGGLYNEGRPGVLHCFTGAWDFAVKLLDLGFCISFSGIVTFRNAAPLREVACKIPDDRLLIETDTPFLTPEPHRGQPNEPRHLAEIARLLARERFCSAQELAETTTRNAERLFGS